MKPAALCAVLALVAPSAPPREDVAGALEELIETTNDLDGFRAVYRIAAEDEDEDEEIELSLVYEAPGRARLELDTPEQRQSVWIVEGRLHMRSWSDGEMTTFADVDLSKSDEVREVEELLYAEFPDLEPEEGAIDPGPSFRLYWRFDHESEKGDLKFDVSYTDPRRQVLAWLDWLTRVDVDLEVGDGLLRVTAEERLAATLSLETGFFTHLRLEREEGALTIELVELDTDPEPGGLEVPEPEAAAEDAAAGMGALRPSLANLRISILKHLDARLRDGDLDWDDSRDGFEAVMRELHGKVLEPNIARMRSGLEEKIAEVQNRIEQELERGRDPAAIRAQTIEFRAQFVTLFDDLEGRSRGQVEDSFPLEDEGPAAGAMLAVELAISSELVEERLRSPVLEAFDQVVDALLGE